MKSKPRRTQTRQSRNLGACALSIITCISTAMITSHHTLHTPFEAGSRGICTSVMSPKGRKAAFSVTSSISSARPPVPCHEHAHNTRVPSVSACAAEMDSRATNQRRADVLRPLWSAKARLLCLSHPAHGQEAEEADQRTG